MNESILMQEYSREGQSYACMEQRINGVWQFYCFMILKAFNYGTAWDSWHWAKAVIKRNPDNFRVMLHTRFGPSRTLMSKDMEAIPPEASWNSQDFQRWKKERIAAGDLKIASGI